MAIPTLELEGARAAHRRLLETAVLISDDQTRKNSLCEGWTIGHVLTHLARNADGHVGQFEAAARGEAAQQYPGGPRQRADDIEAGAGRSAAALVADLSVAIKRLERAWETLPDEVWQSGQGLNGALVRSMPELVYRRWREVEVHHVDLGLSFRPQDWSSGFVDRELASLVASLPARLPPGAGLQIEATDLGRVWLVPESADARRPVVRDSRYLVGWLLGRLSDPSLPRIGPWE